MELVDFGELFHGLHLVGDVEVLVALFGGGADPWAEEGLAGGDSLLWGVFEHLEDQLARLEAHLAPLALCEGHLPPQNFLVDDLVGFTVERRSARQHDVKDDTQRPDVAFFVVLLFDDFRGYIVDLKL